MEKSVKVSLIYSDGRRFTTEINAQIWLRKIRLSKVVSRNDEIYRMNR